MQVQWLAFYLRPGTPPEGTQLPAHVRTRMVATRERLTQMARATGLEIVFPTRIPNTRRAHEATEYARAHGKHQEFHRLIFRLYFGEGKDISHWDVLSSAAEDSGLDPDEMEREVDRGMYARAVHGQIALAQELHITSVPTYILNKKYAFVGAQSYEAFKKVLDRLDKERGSEP